MRKKIALLSITAIFAFATIAIAQDNNTKKTTEPTKCEKKAECKKADKKTCCKGEKKAECTKAEKKACSKK
jgi:hypothetical protein